MSTPFIQYPEIGPPDPSVSHTNGADGSTQLVSPGVPWMLGSQIGGFVFGIAASAILVNQAVGVDQLGNANPLTTALANDGNVVGVANAAVAVGATSWFQTKGAVSVLALTGTAGDLPVYTTATAGVLSEVSTSQVQLHGIRFIAANSSGSTVATNAFAASQIDV